MLPEFVSGGINVFARYDDINIRYYADSGGDK